MGNERIRQLVGDSILEQDQFSRWYCGTNVLAFLPPSVEKSNVNRKNHTHPSYSFLLFFDDFYTLSIEDRIIPSIHGRLQVISPEVYHNRVEQDDPSRYIAVFIAKKFFEKLLIMYSYDAIPGFKGELFEAGDDLLPILLEYMIEGENRMPGFDQAMEGLEKKIGHSLIRSILSMKPNRYPVTHHLEINKVITYIHDHYHEDIDVASASPMCS